MRTTGKAVLCAAMVGAALGAAAPALAVENQADVIRGKAYATQMCGSCHGVNAADETSPAEKAKTFPQIAATPGMTGMAITAWMHSDHPTMPMLIVRPEHLDAIIAYILSLKPAERG